MECAQNGQTPGQPLEARTNSLRFSGSAENAAGAVPETETPKLLEGLRAQSTVYPVTATVDGASKSGIVVVNFW